MSRRGLTPEDKEQSAALGRRLAKLRKDRGLTQVELADKLGVDQSLLSSYEIGRLRPNPALIVRLAAALEVSTDEVLGVAQVKKVQGNAVERRFLRRLRHLKNLPKRDQDALLRTIDAFIASKAAP